MNERLNIESQESIESSIEALSREIERLNEEIWSIEELEEHGTLFTRVSEEIKDWWDFVDQALVGADRNAVLAELEKFVVQLRLEAKKFKKV